MRTDGFEDYAAARWPLLVRVALLLGAPAGLAEDLAADALSRLGRDWRRLRSDGDPDSEVLNLVVAAWAERRRTPWWEEHPSQPAPADLAALDRLPTPERTALVLQHLGDLHVGGPASPAGAGLPAIDPARWVAARSLLVTAPVPGRAELAQVGRRRRARRTRLAVVPVAALALVLLVAVLATAVLRQGGGAGETLPRALAPVAVDEGPDASTTWYADGALHLGAAQVPARGLLAVVDVPDAAVYVDRAGRVVRVALDGDRLLLGRSDDATSLVASADGTRIAWTDTSGGQRRLTVADASDGGSRSTRRIAADDDTRPVGVDDDRVWLAGTDGASVWRPGTAALQPVPSGLRAVTGALAVYGPTTRDAAVRLVRLDRAGRPLDDQPLELLGDEAVAAPSGHLVLSRTTGGQVRVLGLDPLRPLPSGVDRGEVVLDMSVGPDDQVAYVVGRVVDRPRGTDFLRSSETGNVALRTCTVSLALGAVECRDVAQLAASTSTPVLAG